MTIQNLYSFFSNDVKNLAKDIQKIFFPIYWLISMPFTTTYWFLASITFCASAALRTIHRLFNKLFSSKNKSDLAKRDRVKGNFAGIAEVLYEFNHDVKKLANWFQHFTFPIFWLISLPFMATFRIFSIVSSMILKYIAVVWKFLRPSSEKFSSKQARSSTQKPWKQGRKIDIESRVQSSNQDEQLNLNTSFRKVNEDSAKFTLKKGTEYIKQINDIFDGIIVSFERGIPFELLKEQLLNKKNIEVQGNGDVLIKYSPTTSPSKVSSMQIVAADFYGVIRLLMLKVRENLTLCKKRGLDCAHVKKIFKKVSDKYLKKEIPKDKAKEQFSTADFIKNLNYLTALQHDRLSALCGKPVLVGTKYAPILATLNEEAPDYSDSFTPVTLNK